MTRSRPSRSSTPRRGAADTATGPTSLVRATSLVDGLRTPATGVPPVVARGAIVRRPRVVALTERLDAGTSAVEQVRQLCEQHGTGPVRVRTPGRQLTSVPSPEDVHRVLQETPRPFSATREKRDALRHVQPEGVLIPSPEQRAHRLAGPMSDAVHEGADSLLDVGSSHPARPTEPHAPLPGRDRGPGSATPTEETS